MAPYVARCIKCELSLDGKKDVEILKCASSVCKYFIHYDCAPYDSSQLEFLESNNLNIKWFCDECGRNSAFRNETQCKEQIHSTRLLFENRNNGNVTELVEDLSPGEQSYLTNFIEKSRRSHRDIAVQTVHRGAKVFREPETEEEDEEDENEAVNSLMHCLNARVAASEPLKVIVEPSNRFYDTPIDNNVRYYTTRSKSRGNALIINNYQFREESFRNGAIVDQRNLVDLFKQMGLTVYVYENCTAQVMRDVIEDFTEYDRSKECDLCFAIIMSHGREENSETYISGIDDLEVPSSWIESRFNNYNCKIYRNKPKILVYQVCRGPVLDIISQYKKKPQISVHETELNTELNRSYEDMLIANSTMLGYKAHRDPDRGTWFIELMCMMFMEHAHDTHVEELFKKIDEGLRLRMSERGSVQTSTFTNHGFRNCYIHPGIYEEDGVIKHFESVL